MRLLFLTFKWTMLMACPLQNFKGTQQQGRHIFITSFGRYQDDAMDLNAFRFFEKPFDPDRLCSGLDKVMEYIDRTYVDFFVYTNGIHKKIPADDILYVERDNRRSILHTLNETYSARESFDFWEKALQSTYFIQSTNRL